MPTPAQSTTPTALYTAIQTVLQYKLGALSTPLSSSKIFLSWRDPQKTQEGEAVVFYRFSGGFGPFQHPGAGRLAANAMLGLEVVIQTRSNLDQTGRDVYATSQESTNGHTYFQLAVINALHDLNLFDAYDDNTQQPTALANPLTIEPTQFQPSGNVAQPKDNPGWLYSVLNFNVSTVLQLTQQSA